MGLHRAHRQEQLLGDLAVRVAERHEPQDRDLAIRETIGGADGRLGRHARAEPRVEIALPRCGQPDRLDQFLIGCVLEDVPEGAVAERTPRVGRFALHRQNDDLRLRALLAQLRHHVQARATRHIEVEHEHVGPVAPHEALR